MRVLVTGAAGFIGSRLAKRLLARGDEVLGLDNLNDYYPLEHKDRHLADLLPQRAFRFLKGDFRDAPAMRQLMAEHRPQAIAHLGGMAAVRYSVEHPLVYGEVNVSGSLNILDAARHAGVERLVLASSGSVYGTTTPVPFVETAAADQPLAPYPASKRAMELFAHTYHHLFKLRITCVRFFNVYGPHGRPDMMPWQWTFNIHRGERITLYDGGRLRRDWTYVDDLVGGIMAAIDAGFEWEIVNLGCGRPVENIQFVRILESLVGRKAQIVETPAPASEPPITFADITKARRILNYTPQVPVEEGLARFVAWLRDERLLCG